MGKEARYQAIPEDCDLLARARTDRELAELMQFFNWLATRPPSPRNDALRTEFIAAVKALDQVHPGLLERYFYAFSQGYDKIIYLLSPARREIKWGSEDDDDTLIHRAVWGTERLHPEAQATQGRPIGFVPAKNVRIITDYLATITYDMLHEHYDPVRMYEMNVYKIHPDPNSNHFEWIWQEFEGMRRVYQQAAAHGEAMITVID